MKNQGTTTPPSTAGDSGADDWRSGFEAPGSSLLILSPVYNDWDSAFVLLERIDAELVRAGLGASVLFVNDGSNDLPPAGGPGVALRNIERVQVLPLRRNLGHQRAIAIGLSFVEEHFSSRAVVVMDCDGEDLPEHIPDLLKALVQGGEQSLIFAERTRRMERWTFQVMYQLYRRLHHMFTGISVRVGNFSIIPRSTLHRLVVVSEMWNHYAAAVFAAGIQHTSIPTHRGTRIAGRSKMNFTALVGHGLSAISVHSERLVVRVLTGMMGIIGVAALLLLGLFAAKLTGQLSAPAWGAPLLFAFLVLIVQLLSLSIFLVVTIMHRRNVSTFLPSRDYGYYVEEVYSLELADAPVGVTT